MRYLVVLVWCGCCWSAAADVIDFENPADLSLFNYNTGYPTAISNPWSPSVYTTTTGVGGSIGVTAVQSLSLISMIYQNPIEIDNGVRTISLDFNFPVLNTFNLPKLQIGFTGENTDALPGVGSGSSVLLISDDTLETSPHQVFVTLAAVDQTDEITNYSSPSTVVPMSANHWYQVSMSEIVVGTTATIWGSIADIGANGTTSPTTIWSDTEAQGLSFPASLLNNGFSYGGFATDVLNPNTIFPLDNFVTPEPSVVGFLGFCIAAMLKRRRRGSRVRT